MPVPRPRTCRNRWLAGAAWLGLATAALTAAAAPVPAPVVVVASVAPRPAALAPAPSESAPPQAVHPPALPAGFAAAPLVRQAHSYSCGAAALASVLRYFQVWDGPETKLYRPLGTSPAEGTLPERLAEVARTFGLRARVRQPMTIPALREALHKGRLVILELQAWPNPGAPAVPWASRWDDGHYVVLVALDDQYAYFMDPSTEGRYTYLALAELGPRWHDVNQVRREPLQPHDLQLGVVIGRPVTGPPAVVPAAPVATPKRKLRPLRKLE